MPGVKVSHQINTGAYSSVPGHQVITCNSYQGCSGFYVKINWKIGQNIRNTAVAVDKTSSYARTYLVPVYTHLLSFLVTRVLRVKWEMEAIKPTHHMQQAPGMPGILE